MNRILNVDQSQYLIELNVPGNEGTFLDSRNEENSFA